MATCKESLAVQIPKIRRKVYPIKGAHSKQRCSVKRMSTFPETGLRGLFYPIVF